MGVDQPAVALDIKTRRENVTSNHGHTNFERGVNFLLKYIGPDLKSTVVSDK